MPESNKAQPTETDVPQLRGGRKTPDTEVPQLRGQPGDPGPQLGERTPEAQQLQAQRTQFLSSPTFEEEIVKAGIALKEAGFTTDEIRAIVTVGGLPTDLKINWGKVDETLHPLWAQNGEAARETLKQAESLSDEGIELDISQVSALRLGMLSWASNTGEATLVQLSENSRGWKKVVAKASESLAGKAAMMAAGEGAGVLSSLDFVSFLVKAQRLPFLPAKHKQEIASRVLPPIILQDEDGEDRAFSTGTSAAWWVMQQRLKGVGEFIKELTVDNLYVNNSSTPLYRTFGFEAGQREDVPEQAGGGAGAGGPVGTEVPIEQRRSVRLMESAGQQIPLLAASIGEPLSWQEVVGVQLNYQLPRGFSGREGMSATDDIYNYMYDLGDYTNTALMVLALGSGTADIFVDLLWILPGAGIPSKGFEVGGKFLSRLASKTAPVLTALKISKNTWKLEDAANAVSEAATLLRRVRSQGEKMKAGPSGKRTVENARQELLATKMELDAKQFLDTFREPGAYEVITLRRTPRKNPDLDINGIDKARRYTDNPDVAAEISRSREIEVRRPMDLVADWEHATGNQIARRAMMGPDDGEQFGDALNLFFRTGGMGLDDIALTPQILLDQRYPDTSIGLIKTVVQPKRAALRKFDWLWKDAQKGMTPQERLAQQPLLRAIDHSEGSDLSKNTMRLIVTEMDKTMQSLGEARNARGGQVIPVGRPGVVKSDPTKGRGLEVPPGKVGARRAGDRPGDAIFKARGIKAAEDSKAIEGLQKEIEALWDGLVSGKPKTIIQGEDVVQPFIEGRMPQGKIQTTLDLVGKKEIEIANLRQALEGPNKGLISSLEKQLKLQKVEMEKIAKQGFFKENVKFDDAWLPGSHDPTDANPSIFRRRMNLFSEQVSESIYPGSFMNHRFWETRVGQAMGNLREPLRYYDQYDPETGNIVRAGYMRYKRNTEGGAEIYTNLMARAGVLKERSKWNPKKQWKAHTFDEVKREEMFHIMNTLHGSDEWTALYQAASPEMREATDVLRKVMDHWADVQGISDTEKYLLGYMRHNVDPKLFEGGARPVELDGLRGTAEQFVSHLLNRKGNAEYTPDIVAALDVYNRSMNRKLHLEPVFEQIQIAGRQLSAKHDNPHFNQYADYLVRHLKGQPSVIGHAMDNVIAGSFPSWQPGTIDRAGAGFASFIWGGTLAGNPRYSVMQMATGSLTSASRYGVGRTLKGLWSMGTAEGQAMAKEAGVYHQFNNMFEGRLMNQFTDMLANIPVVTPLGVMSTAKTEFYVRGATFHAAVDMYLTKLGFASWQAAREAGMGRSIIFSAIRGTEETNHMYGALGRSPVAGNFVPKGMVVSATQFLSFIPKQIEELSSQFQRNPGKIAEYMMLSGWLTRVASETVGIDMTNYVGFGFIPAEINDVTTPALTAITELMDAMTAIGERDPQAADLHMGRAMQTLDNLLPTMVMWESLGKSATRILSGESTNARGEKQRNLDFKQSLNVGYDRKYNDERTLIERVAASIRPDTKRTIGGDLIPSMFGQRNINDLLFRRTQGQIRADSKKRLFIQQKATKKYTDALLYGTKDEQDAALKEYEALLVSDVFRLPEGARPFDHLLTVGMFGWGFRELKGNKLYQDKVLQRLDEGGVKIDP